MWCFKNKWPFSYTMYCTFYLIFCRQKIWETCCIVNKCILGNLHYLYKSGDLVHFDVETNVSEIFVVKKQNLAISLLMDIHVAWQMFGRVRGLLLYRNTTWGKIKEVLLVDTYIVGWVLTFECLDLVEQFVSIFCLFKDLIPPTC